MQLYHRSELDWIYLQLGFCGRGSQKGRLPYQHLKENHANTPPITKLSVSWKENRRMYSSTGKFRIVHNNSCCIAKRNNFFLKFLTYMVRLRIRNCGPKWRLRNLPQCFGHWKQCGYSREYSAYLLFTVLVVSRNSSKVPMLQSITPQTLPLQLPNRT